MTSITDDIEIILEITEDNCSNDSTNDKFKCTFCSRSFASNKSRRYHERFHTGSDLLKCRFCEKTFPLKSACVAHERTHTRECAFSCDICGDSFQTRRHLQSHGKKVHNNINTYLCQYCDVLCKTALARRQHESTHTNTRQLQCDKCEKRFSDKSNFRRHLQTHDNDGAYQCKYDQCEAVFNSSYQLEFHTTRVHSAPVVKEPHQCNICEKSFINKTRLKTHLLIHSDLRPFKCSYCDDTFKYKDNLSKHERMHTGIGITKCNFCDSTFTTDSSRKIHERTHTGENLFHCSFCEKSFTLKNYLVAHELKHTGQSPFECKQCLKRFRSLRLLKSHKLTHSDYRPFNCAHCSKAFRTNSLCKQHERKVHTIVDNEESTETFPCPDCNKVFKSIYQLKLHSVAHSDQRPFLCKHCGKAYSLNSSCKRHELAHSDNLVKCNYCKKVLVGDATRKQHERIHTGEKPFGCTLCNMRFLYKSSFLSHKRKCKELLFKCGKCGRGFSDEVICRKHESLHRESEPSRNVDSVEKKNRFQCNLCGRLYKYKGGLKAHILTHLEQETTDYDNAKKLEFIAFNVKNESVDSEQSNSFVNTISSEQKATKFKCMECYKIFSNKLKLKHHSVVHTGEKPYTCNYCAKSYSLKESWRKHELSHSDNLLKCNYCEKCFISESSRRRHECIHTGEKPYNCNLCDAKFLYRKSCLAHKYKCKDLLFKCRHCGRRFRKKTQCKKHEGLHQNEDMESSKMVNLTDENRFRCEVCDKSYKSKGSLTKHERTHLEQTKYSIETDVRKPSNLDIALKLKNELHDEENNFSQSSNCSNYSKYNTTDRDNVISVNFNNTDETLRKDSKTNNTQCHTTDISVINTQLELMFNDIPTITDEKDRENQNTSSTALKSGVNNACGRSYNDSIVTTANNHEDIIKSDNTMFVSLIDASSTEIIQFDIDTNKSNDESSTNKCNFCELIFEFQAHRVRHERTHDCYKCRYCPKISTKESEHRLHELSHNDAKKNYEVCYKKYLYYKKILIEHHKCGSKGRILKKSKRRKINVEKKIELDYKSLKFADKRAMVVINAIKTEMIQ